MHYFQSLGLKIHIIRDVPKAQKGISATDIRLRMMGDKPWEHLVPESVAAYLKRWRLPLRLKTIQSGP